MDHAIIMEPEKLKHFVYAIFSSVGVPNARAETIADCLVEANVRGIDSHGVIRVPIYVKRILAGLTEVSGEVKTVFDYPASAVIDGKNIIGQVAGEFAMRTAIEKARTVGVGVVGLRETNHFGTCSHYSLLATKEDMIGICLVNTTPLVATFGGTRKAMGNNPVSVAIPAKTRYPVVLDMACSVAQGKIEMALKQGKAIPAGWAVDAEGRPTTDANAALQGVLLPIAGPKGSGLAIVNDILCGILTGSGVGNEVLHLNDDAPQHIGAIFAAIDISKFADISVFKRRVDAYIEYLKSTAREGEQILMPGESEFLTAEERGKKGIPVPIAVRDDLNDVARLIGVAEQI